MITVEPIKIVFWDLDGTIWGGTLEEDADIATVPLASVRDVLHKLDQRGIVHSVVSQAKEAAAAARLQEHGLLPLFLRPKFDTINKAQAIAATLNELRLLPGNAAFIDDLPFYRAEVAELLPDVLVVAPAELPFLLDNPRLQGGGALGSTRRLMYQTDELRESEQRAFVGSRVDFLMSCNMVLTCSIVGAAENARLTELFRRAHRLSSAPAGQTPAVPQASRNRSTVTLGRQASQYAGVLHDRFGDYGIIAGARIYPGANTGEAAVCERIALSCRVQGRGVLEAFVAWLVRRCLPQQLHFAINTADDVNGPLRTALRFCGFGPVSKDTNSEMLTLVSPERLAVPAWIHIAE